MCNFRMVATDLDGTFLRTDKQVSAHTMEPGAFPLKAGKYQQKNPHDFGMIVHCRKLFVPL